MRCFAALASLAVLLPACTALPHPPSASGPAGRLTVSGDRLFLAAEINGAPVTGLLDSGAEMTLLDAGAASRLGLVTEGSAEARGTGAGTLDVAFASGLTLAAGGVTLTDQTLAVLDLSDVARRLVGVPFDAILGKNLFDAGRFRLDIETGHFARSDDPPSAGAVRLSLTDAAGIRQVPVRVNGELALADFDLGNGNRPLMSAAFAARLGILGQAAGAESGGGIGGEVTRRLVRLDRVEVAGVVFPGLVAAISDAPDDPDFNVGVPILRTFEMWIDFPAGEVWLAPRAG